MRYLLILFLLTASAWAAESTAVCTFADDTEVSVRYNSVSTKDTPKAQNGKIWTPGGAPVVLFAQTELSVNNISLPVGAYNVYFIPGKDAWTLVINKNVTAGSAYDEKSDVVRLRMEGAKLGSPADRLNISFGRIAPKQCEIRAYFDQSGTWATISEK
jgi:hypothetical protein